MTDLLLSVDDLTPERLSAVLGGTNSLHTNALDEVLALPGEAAAETIDVFARLLSPSGRASVTAIRNDYFGGDVNVTGLIVSEDLLAQLPADLAGTLVVLPEVMFNFDRLTLDGDTQERILGELARRGGRAIVSVTSPTDYLDSLLAALA